MPYPETVRRISVDIDGPDRSDLDSMVSLFIEAFQLENPQLAQLMYTTDRSFEVLYGVVNKLLETHLNTANNKLMIAYDNADAPGCPRSARDIEPEDMDNLIFGWISANVVTHDATRNAYAGHELSTYACLRVLAEQARTRGDNDVSIGSPCARLLRQLVSRSKLGPVGFIANDTYLVVNALVLWPDCHEVTNWEIAFKLLGWAVSFAERRNLPIWTQIPVNQMGFFHHAGFTEVRAFTLDLNNYAPRRSMNDWGTQEFVQMVYLARGERRTRSISPRDGGGRRRRPSF